MADSTHPHYKPFLKQTGHILKIFSTIFREDFHYDQGNKTGRAILKGASGAIREGTKKNGNWHGPAKFTSQDGEVKDERWDNGRKI